VQDIHEVFTAPFSFDGEMYIFDAHFNVAAERHGAPRKFEARGWGHMCTLPNASRLFRQWVELLDEVTCGSIRPSICISRLNEEWNTWHELRRSKSI
jgi:hypothetical protein